MKEMRFGEVGLQRCAVKFCEQPIIVGGIVTGTEDVWLELCEHHASQFNQDPPKTYLTIQKPKVLEKESK